MLSTDVGAASAAATRLQESAPAPGTVARRESRTSGRDDDFGEMFDRFADESTPAETGRTARRKGAPAPGLPQLGVSASESASIEESPAGRGAKGVLGQLPTWEPGIEADETVLDLAATVPVFDARLIVATQLQPQLRGDMSGVSTQGQTQGWDRSGPAAVASPVPPGPEVAPGGPDVSAVPFGLPTAAPGTSVDGLPVPDPALLTTAGPDTDADTDEVGAAPAPAMQTVPAPGWNPEEMAAVPTVGFDAVRPAHDGPAAPPQTPGSTPNTPPAPTVASGVNTVDAVGARQVAMAAIRSALTRELDTPTPSATPSTPPGALPAVSAADGTAPIVPDTGVTAAGGTPRAPETFEVAASTVPAPAAVADVQPRTSPGAPDVASHAPAHKVPGPAAKAGQVATPAGAPVTTTPVPAAVSAPDSSASQTPEPAAVSEVDSKPAGGAQPVAGRAQTPAGAAVAVPAPSVETPGGQVAAASGRKGGHTDDAPLATARPSARVAHAIAAFQAASLTGLGAGASGAVQTPPSVALPDTLLDQELPTQIVQAIRVQFDQGSGEARLRLNPGFLGGMTVGVQVDGTSVVASLYASSADVRDWMQRNEQVLRQSLADQGLQLERLVIVDEEAQAAADDERGRGQREQQEQQSSRRPRRPVEEGTFELVL